MKEINSILLNLMHITTRITSCKNKVFLFLLLTLYGTLQAQERSSLEIIQASYIQKFVKYTQWPEPQSKVKYFKVGVIGDSIYMDRLRYIFSHKKIKEKGVILVYIDSLKDLPELNVLFISDKANDKLNDILAAATERSILTISHTKGWAQKGVCINFYIINNKHLRFEINTHSLEMAQLKVDALLLDYARVVN